MRGSIYKRGSTWTWHVDVGVDPVTGKRKQQTKGGFKTKRECQAALNDALAALRAGTLVKPSKRTLESFLVGEWLPDRRAAPMVETSISLAGNLRVSTSDARFSIHAYDRDRRFRLEGPTRCIST
jgi:Arm DNA-binding domain